MFRADQLPIAPQRAGLISCLAAAEVPQALPATPQFDISASPHNIRLRFTPLAIVLPTAVSHVQAAVACGRELSVRVNARAGGHNYASHRIGGEDGHLVIDLRYMNTTSVDPVTGIATVGPGTRLGNMAIALDAQGKRALPHGVCPKVGVGGHVLHGGWGYSTHNHGLFLDHLDEAQVVLADSSVVTASTTQNSDLFWALRGAGMSFGIVTRFEFRTIDQPEQIQLFYIPFVWNLSQAEAGWHIFQDYVSSPGRPKEMNIRVVISSGAALGYQGTIFLFEGAYHGSQADYEAGIKSFRDAVIALGGFGGSLLPVPEATNVSYMDALLYANNNALLFGTADAEPLESNVDDQIQTNGFFKSMMTGALSDAAVNALMTTISDASQTNPNRSWLIIAAAIGGPNSAVPTVPSESTSYAHRSSLFVWELGDVVVGVNQTYPSAIGIPWLDTLVDAVESAERTTLGMYYNYADPDIGNGSVAGQRYWPGHYSRLADLKRIFDPMGVFENPQTVRWETPVNRPCDE